MKLDSLFKFIPEEIRALFFLKIFTTYSYAVLYSSLILYMTNSEGISNQYATGVVGVFISINFILHFFGGIAGGKLVSNRMLLFIGMIMELIGVSLIQFHLFLGLGIFLTGSGLYVTSINAIMIQKYEPNDNKREIASFWVYSGMNLGFFLGHTVGGYFHIQNNYQWLFYSAITVTFASILLISLNWYKFDDKSTELSFLPPADQRKRLLSSIGFLPFIICLVIFTLIYNSQSSKLVMLFGGIIFCSTLLLAVRQPDQNDKNKVFAFIILVCAALAFWSLFFIGPMGLTLFIKQYVNKDLFGISIAPQWFNNINTGMIVIGGPLLANWFNKKRESGSDFSVPFLFSLALLNIGAAYIILTLGIMITGDNHLLGMGWIVLSYVLQTMGELLLSPVGVAMVGKLAPKGKQGLLLGIWALVSGIASMISKYLSQMMVIPTLNSTSSSAIQTYNHVFSMIGWGSIFAGILLLSLVPFVKKLMDGDERLNQKLEEEFTHAI